MKEEGRKSGDENEREREKGKLARLGSSERCQRGEGRIKTRQQRGRKRELNFNTADCDCEPRRVERFEMSHRDWRLAFVLNSPTTKFHNYGKQGREGAREMTKAAVAIFAGRAACRTLGPRASMERLASPRLASARLSVYRELQPLN